MSGALLTPIVTAVLGILVATIVALVNGALSSRASESEGLRTHRLEAYPEVWKLTAAVSRWPRTDISYRDLWALHKSLRTWYFDTGGLFLSENSRSRYGEMQELIDAWVAGRPEKDATTVAHSATTDRGARESAYEALMLTCSAFRTALTEDLATRRSRSLLWAAILWKRHRDQKIQAEHRIRAARVGS
jgi:hypothetical protein